MRPEASRRLEHELPQHSLQEHQAGFLDHPGGEYKPRRPQERHAGEPGQADREHAHQPEGKDVGRAQQQVALAAGVKVADRQRQVRRGKQLGEVYHQQQHHHCAQHADHQPQPRDFERLEITKAGLQEHPPQEPQEKSPPEHAGDAEPGRRQAAQDLERGRLRDGPGESQGTVGIGLLHLARLDLLVQRLGLLLDAVVHLLLEGRLRYHGDHGEHSDHRQQQCGHEPIPNGNGAGLDPREHLPRNGKDIQQPRRERHRGRRRSVRRGFQDRQRFFHTAKSESNTAQQGTVGACGIRPRLSSRQHHRLRAAPSRARALRAVAEPDSANEPVIAARNRTSLGRHNMIASGYCSALGCTLMIVQCRNQALPVPVPLMPASGFCVPSLQRPQIAKRALMKQIGKLPLVLIAMISLALPASAQVPYVIVISVDGLGGTYLSKLFDGGH